MKERIFKKSYAQELLNIGKNDLIAAKALSVARDIRFETVFFLLQQSVEKSLKALLVSIGKSVPLSHDLALIMDRLNVKPNRSDDLNELTDFASVRRYEEGTFIVTAEEMTAAIQLVEETLIFCETEISKN